jgi:ATPase family associated with various cellular activities (AAA)
MYLDLSKVTDFSVMPKVIRDSMSDLTPRERKYFMTMWPKSGVMYITSKPGIAKSAIARSIADKMNFRYMDIRLSMVDETDVGLYPNISDVDGIKCLDFVVPKWALEANKQPTIIHFEELNRATLQVRNAALQILLERQIGIDFKFNDTVLMMCSGNLGDEDGTDVEEFDNALNNRLIHFNHTLGADEWIDNFAKVNIHNVITSYIKAFPEKLYQNPTENSKAYATPRSWRFLSDFIIQNFGKDASPKEFLPALQEVAHGYIGNGAQRFLQYCQEMINLTIHDILDRYDQVEKELAKYNRDKNSELINSLKEFDIKKLTEKQLNNVTKFLQRVGQDELTAYLLHVLDNVPDVSDPKIKRFMQTFKDVLVNIKRINKPGDKK